MVKPVVHISGSTNSCAPAERARPARSRALRRDCWGSCQPVSYSPSATMSASAEGAPLELAEVISWVEFIIGTHDRANATCTKREHWLRLIGRTSLPDPIA